MQWDRIPYRRTRTRNGRRQDVTVSQERVETERERETETERERGEEHGEVAKRKARAPHDRERQTRELVPTAQVDLQARAFKLSELIQESVCSVSRGEIHASGTS